MPEEEKKSRNIFLYLLLLGCAVAIGTSFYFYYFKKDYSFVVEVACDPTKEACFQRDCTNPGDCPPNELSSFKRYNLNAGDFRMCGNEDCAIACETGLIKCEKVECTENLDAGESCSTQEAPAENQ